MKYLNPTSRICITSPNLALVTHCHFHHILLVQCQPGFKEEGIRLHISGGVANLYHKKVWNGGSIFVVYLENLVI